MGESLLPGFSNWVPGPPRERLVPRTELGTPVLLTSLTVAYSTSLIDSRTVIPKTSTTQHV
jgi:hypothetical protein